MKINQFNESFLLGDQNLVFKYRFLHHRQRDYRIKLRAKLYPPPEVSETNYQIQQLREWFEKERDTETTNFYSFAKEIEWERADLISNDSLNISHVPLEFDKGFKFSIANKSLENIALLIVQDKVKNKIYSYLLASRNSIQLEQDELLNEIQSNKDIFIIEKSEKFQEENIYKYAPKRCF